MHAMQHQNQVTHRRQPRMRTRHCTRMGSMHISQRHQLVTIALCSTDIRISMNLTSRQCPCREANERTAPSQSVRLQRKLLKGALVPAVLKVSRLDEWLLCVCLMTVEEAKVNTASDLPTLTHSVPFTTSMVRSSPIG